MTDVHRHDPNCTVCRARERYDARRRITNGRKAEIRAELLRQVREAVEAITDLQPAAASMKRRVITAIDKLAETNQ